MLAAPLYCNVCGAANGSDAEVCFACGKLLNVAVLSAESTASNAVLIQQRYRILSQIGQGGFGAVLHAMLSGIDPSEEPFHFELVEGLSVTYSDLNPLLLHTLEMNANKRPGSIATIKVALQHIQTQQPLSGQLAAGPIAPVTPIPPVAPIPATTNTFYPPYIAPQYTAATPAAPMLPPASAAYPNRALVASKSQLVCTYARHANKIRAVAWSPDGTRIASGGADATTHVWDARSGTTKAIYFTPSANAEIRAVAWSPDSQYIVTACAEDTVIQVWKAP